MKYKIGDKVRVRESLRYDTRYAMDDNSSSNYVNHQMGLLFGKVVTITGISSGGQYRVQEDSHLWTDGMFEGERSMKYKVGDKVRIKEDLVNDRRYYMNDMESSDFANFVMCRIAGEVTTIVSSKKDGYKIMGSVYFWTDEMFEGKVEKNMFTIEDLRQGDLVIDNECCKYNVKKVVGGVVCNHVDESYAFINSFDSDLTHKSNKVLDIVKVYRPRDFYDLSTMDIEVCDLVWEREEPKVELTLEEIAEKFGYDVKRIRIKD